MLFQYPTNLSTVESTLGFELADAPDPNAIPGPAPTIAAVVYKLNFSDWIFKRVQPTGTIEYVLMRYGSLKVLGPKGPRKWRLMGGPTYSDPKQAVRNALS